MIVKLNKNFYDKASVNEAIKEFHDFFDGKIINNSIEIEIKMKKKEDVAIPIPKIDKAKCDLCGKCSAFCQYNALAVIPDDVLFFQNLCHGCGGCSIVCPKNAITEKKRIIGVIERGYRENMEFYRGVLNIGEPMATPIIKALKKKIDNKKNVILDSPPGTACPMIETIRETDFCILVTEPTPFGLHDLKIAVEVTRTLNVPYGVIINRDGIGDDRVEKYSHTEKIPILMKIPYNKEIARLYSKGFPFVLEMPEWKKKFTDLYKLIEREVRK